MMSNPPSSLHQQHRQRLHRRQNSTPVVAFEAMKVSSLPQSPTHRQGFHRRGQSYDQTQRSPIRRHHGNAVSITNLGHYGQQILREAQQERTARPGQHQVEIPVSPQCGLYTASNPTTPYDNMTMNSIMQSSQAMQFANSAYFPHDMPVQALFQSPGYVDENNQHYFQSGPHVLHESDLLFDGRRMSQPDLRVHTNLRPHTPTEQIQNAHFPPTPPFTQHAQTEHYSRSLQASPAIHSPYPVPMQRGRSLQGIIEREELKQEEQHQDHENTFPATAAPSFDIAEIPVPTAEVGAGSPSPQPEPVKKEEPLPFFDETGGEEAPELDDHPIPSLSYARTAAGSQSPSRPALSPRRMSISDLNLEPGINASIEETNITLDDIAQFIEGPDPRDNKWVCKFEDCNKKFGRKENIKSHVQTHLGDRQFRCDHCKKCFVRGHDLKRHAKIHTGSKPYPCLCGNAFARHDALTRHRQRGMCIGAFDGVVKKIIKRGRPRKHRPEMDERLDKAARARRRANDHLDQYASSTSSCSLSSWGSPPTESMDALSIRGNSPFDDMALFGVPQQNMGMENVGFPPNLFSFTPPASPGYSTGNKPSPSYRELTPADLGDVPQLQSNSSQMIPGLPVIGAMPLMANAMTIQHSQHSLPSLSHSSSSPAADVVAFDFSDMSSGAIQAIPMKMESDRNDFDNFLDYGGMDMGLDAGGPDSFFTNL